MGSGRSSGSLLPVICRMRIPRSLVLVAYALTLYACGDSSAPTTRTTGPAAVLVKSAGDGQSADDGTPVTIPPAVAVQDANGNPVAGATVIFAVGAGVGTLTGDTQITNASGVATVGSWTLGTPGTNTLTATAGSLPAVTFTATATPRAACSVATPHTIGTTSTGALTTDDCRISLGAFVDFFSTGISPTGAYLFNQTAASFDSYLYLYGADGFIVGANDDDPSSTLLDSRIKALLPSDNYQLGVSSYSPAATGSYTISSAPTSDAITSCDQVFVARGISTSQNLETTDCNFGGFYDDDMYIFLQAGQTVTITMQSTALDAYLELWNFNGLVAANDDMTPGTTTDAQIVYTVPANAFYIIVPSSSLSGVTGAYTLLVQ